MPASHSVVRGKGNLNVTAAAATFSSSSPSRPRNQIDLCGEGKNDEIEDGWTKNVRDSLSESELADEEGVLTAAFGDLMVDECAPHAMIEEMYELELELRM